MIIGIAEQLAISSITAHVTFARRFENLRFNGKHIERNLSTAIAANIKEDVLIIAADI